MTQKSIDHNQNFGLCKYKNIFGKPNTGLHNIRIFDIAIVDVLATMFVTYIICSISTYSYLPTLVVMFILGIVAHRLFCVRTRVDKLLFPN